MLVLFTSTSVDLDKNSELKQAKNFHKNVSKEPHIWALN